MAVTSTSIISNPGTVSAAIAAQIIANTQAAFGKWAEKLAGNANIEIEITLKTGMGSALASAGSGTSVFITSIDGRNLFLDGTAAEMLTGTDPNGRAADILISVDLDDIRANVFYFDPSNGAGTSVPRSQVDYISVAMHEIGHGLGFNGWATQNYSFTGVSAISTFDRFITTQNGQGIFTGANTVAANGGVLKLDSGPHVDESLSDLMNPSAPNGEILVLRPVDFAVLSDIGVPTILNDHLVLPSDSGTLNGGAGLDTLTMFGGRSAFTVSGNTVSMPFHQWQMQEIERLAFTDGVLALDLDGNAGQVYRLYQAAFARTPDTGGLAHNVKLVDGGMTLATMSGAFIGSQEFIQRYGSDVTDTTYINALYLNVLGRNADAAGLAGWQERLADGSWTRSTVLIGFSESAENKTLVGAAISNGIWLGLDGALTA